MASKEATVYIIDLGSSMADCNNGRTESDLDFSMRYVWDKIANTVSTGRKTLFIGVVGLRTDETRNDQADQGDEGYENISVLQPLGAMTLADLRALKEAVKPSDSMSGDAVSAVVVATEMIVAFTKELKYDRKIVLVTDGLGVIDGDALDEIAGRINEKKIQLSVIGVDFDDPEYGFKEEDKAQLKATNETLLSSLVDSCDNGAFGSMAQAVAELVIPVTKSVKLIPSFNGSLTIGDPGEYGNSAISINVVRYAKTKRAMAESASTVVVKSEPTGSRSTQTLGGGEMEGVEYGGEGGGGIYNSVKNTRTYKINDPNAPGGKRDIEFEALSKGYTYGSTAFGISESDWNVTNLDTKKSFSILGFVPKQKYEPFLSLGETSFTIASKMSEKSELSLSALIWALSELESYAVARLVIKDGKDPLLVLLIPGLEPEMECLYDVPLPYAEDVRRYQFPPLDRVITVTGTELTKHKRLPDDKLNQAMSDFVDKMDISTYNQDEDGNPSEWAALDENYSPNIHRVKQAIRARAIYPDEKIEEVPAVLVKFSRPPEDLIAGAKSEIDSLRSVANVKKVLDKAKSKPGRDSEPKPIGRFDADDLFSSTKGTTSTETKEFKRITMENSIPDFKHNLRESSEYGEVEDSAKQLGGIIKSFISTSLGDSGYDRALENLGVMRQQMASYEFPEIYNNFLRDLKGQLLSGGELGGDRRAMWNRIKYSRNLGLIHQGQLPEASKVTEAEAAEFLQKK